MYLCIRLKISTKFMPQNLCIDQFDARTEWRCDFATAIKQFTKYFVKTVYRMAKNVSSDFQRLLVFPIERYSCLTALDILSIRKHLQPLKVTLDVYLPFYNIVFPPSQGLCNLIMPDRPCRKHIHNSFIVQLGLGCSGQFHGKSFRETRFLSAVKRFFPQG